MSKKTPQRIFDRDLHIREGVKICFEESAHKRKGTGVIPNP